MIAKLLISPSLENRKKEIQEILMVNLKGYCTDNHPDLLYFPIDSKLGIEQARMIKKHFSLKPYSAKGRVVVLEDAGNLTIEAQNALLKTIEELPENGLLVLSADSDAKLLPTIISRCQIVNLKGEKYNNYKGYNDYTKDLDNLLKADIPERFEYVEKLKDKQEFLQALVLYFHQNLASNTGSLNVNFLKELLQAEKWAKSNVNVRAILEYLILVMPSK